MLNITRIVISLMLMCFLAVAVFSASLIVTLGSGILAGYLLVTIAESFVHEHVHHARKTFRGLQRRFPLTLNVFYQAYRSHTLIHHAQTYKKDHITQFNDGAHKASVDSMLLDHHGRRIIQEGYGRTINLSSALYFLVPLLPFIIPVCAFAPPAFTAGFAIPVAIYPLMSMVIHPYLHMRHDDAVQEAPWWLRMILTSAYMRCVWRHHWLHHRYPRHNFNLLLGGDLLRGVHKTPSASDLEAMRKIGMPVD